MRHKIGESVEWVTKFGQRTIARSGVIVAIIAPNKNPIKILGRSKIPGVNLSRAAEFKPRKYHAYVVAAIPIGITWRLFDHLGISPNIYMPKTKTIIER